MNRRGFLRRGAVVGMAGALIGASVGKAQDVAAGEGGDYRVPTSGGVAMDPLPELPADRTGPAEVEFLPTATFRPDYVWSGNGPITVDPERSVELSVEINGRRYVMYAGTPYGD
jgi:hypothetical protein